MSYSTGSIKNKSDTQLPPTSQQKKYSKITKIAGDALLIVATLFALAVMFQAPVWACVGGSGLLGFAGIGMWVNDIKDRKNKVIISDKNNNGFL